MHVSHGRLKLGYDWAQIYVKRAFSSSFYYGSRNISTPFTLPYSSINPIYPIVGISKLIAQEKYRAFAIFQLFSLGTWVPTQETLFRTSTNQRDYLGPHYAPMYFTRPIGNVPYSRSLHIGRSNSFETDSTNPLLKAISGMIGLGVIVYFIGKSLWSNETQAIMAWLKDEETVSAKSNMKAEDNNQKESIYETFSSKHEPEDLHNENDSDYLSKTFVGWFWSFVWEELFLIVCVVGSGMLGAYVGVRIPGSIGYVIETITRLSYSTDRCTLFDFNRSLRNIFYLLKDPIRRLLCLFGIYSILGFSQIWLNTLLGERFSTRLKNDLFASLIYRDVVFFDQHTSTEIVSHLNQDIQELKHAMKQCFSQGLTSLAQLIGSTINLYTRQPMMTLYLWLPIPIIYSLGNLYGIYLRRLSKKLRAFDMEASGVAQEAIGHIRIVKAYSMEPSEENNYRNATRLASHHHSLFGFHFGIFQGLTSASTALMTLNVLLYGCQAIFHSQLNPGDLTSFLLSSENIQRALGNLVILFHTLVRAQTAASQLSEWLEIRPTILEKTITNYQLERLDGKINFDRVTFAYPTRPNQNVLNEIQFEVPPGKIVAIVGPSGAGKSTVVSLIERFYDPISGRIILDGHDIKDLDLVWLRQNIGYITQDPALFNATIFENIGYGKQTASEAEVIRAAKLAHCHDFISKFPKGYNTKVGERGVQLSGGKHTHINFDVRA